MVPIELITFDPQLKCDKHLLALDIGLASTVTEKGVNLSACVLRYTATSVVYVSQTKRE